MPKLYDVYAEWNADEDRYVVDPSDAPVDCGTGWLSSDGDVWTQNGTDHYPDSPDFACSTIHLVGGPRDGETVAEPRMPPG